MKNFMLASMIALSGLAHAVDTGINPQYLKMKVYRMAVSRSVYCTNPQVVITNVNPQHEDILGSPTLGTGSLLNGSYPCVIFEISDAIKFAPDQNSDSGACALGEEIVMDVCRDESTKSIEGVVSPCQVGEDKVTIYMSTVSTDAAGAENGVNAFTPPTQGAHNLGLKLNNQLIVAGPHTGTFVVNGLGKVSDIPDGEGRQCEMNPPAFSFR